MPPKDHKTCQKEYRERNKEHSQKEEHENKRRDCENLKRNNSDLYKTQKKKDAQRKGDSRAKNVQDTTVQTANQQISPRNTFKHKSALKRSVN